MVGGCRQDLTESGYGPMEGFWKNDNEPSGSKLPRENIVPYA